MKWSDKFICAVFFLVLPVLFILLAISHPIYRIYNWYCYRPATVRRRKEKRMKSDAELAPP